MHILDVLKERGFIAQMTFEDELYKQLEEPTTSTWALIPPLTPCTSAITSRSWPWPTCSAPATSPSP